MSYIPPSHRLFDSPDLSPFPPIHNNNSNTPSRMLNLSSYDPLPLPQHPSSLAPDQSFNKFPKVGETRCYWTLLSADLHFLYLDPVLAHHLVDQANDLVGKSLFDFVHPDEKASATHDLRNVLESRTLHGSVTRMRYSRLSRVRRLLGYQGPHHVWPEAEKIAIDSNYMAVDLVINWAAEGLVLCFIHAVVDLTPYDNDEHVKTGWTNWCGTSAMNDQEAQLLYQRLLHSIPQSGNMSRAFQILLNQSDRPLLFSWPPQQAQGPTASDFAKLSDEVQIENSPHTGNDAKTSCTRRYKALQNMTSSDGVREVESIFIPHGSIIFACHKVNSPSRSSSTSNASMQQQQSNYDTGYMGSQSQQFYSDQTTGSYALPPMQVSPTSSYSFLSQSSQVPVLPPFSAQPWSTGPDPSTSHQLLGSQWTSAASPASYTSGPPQTRVSPYASQQQQQQQQQQQTPAPLQRQWSPQPSPYAEMDNPMPQASYSRPLSPSYGYSSCEVQQAPPPNPDTVPPPKTGQRRTSPSNSRDQYGSGGRSSGHPPVGITRCSSCKVTQSPEWRKGPSGKKDLCNACGLRYARSRAKKEGIAQRRRKDKAMGPTPKQEQQSPKPLSATPPLSAPYSGLRQASYEDTSFTSTSPAGSGSGSEVYPPPGPPGPQAFNSLTPSPSPPAGNVGFQHYPSHRHARESDVRQQYPSSTPSYYPSPLSNTGVQHGSHGNGGHGHTLSRIESLPQLVNRMSPLLSSASSSSPGPGHAASYERERDRDRDSITLPPTPLSADPRHGPASKMTFVTQ